MRYKRLPAVRTEKKERKKKNTYIQEEKYTRQYASRKTEKEEGRRDSLRRVASRRCARNRGHVTLPPPFEGPVCVRAALLPPPSPHSYPLRRSSPGSYEAVEGCVRDACLLSCRHTRVPSIRSRARASSRSHTYIVRLDLHSCANYVPAIGEI